ncbi:MAG: NnrU family protein [Proteobacteria bacterium]|nr:NnrU family protein [Pseudomonadota bacterium]
MTYFIIGLLIFLGTHSVRIIADEWRSSQVSRLGLIPWKLLYGLVSACGFGLIVWGYSIARPDSAVIWNPPLWTRHVAALLTLPAFVLIVAAYIPRNRIRAGVGHPMVLGVQLWALAHLPANGRAIDLLLFGSFLVWAALDYFAALRLDKNANTSPAAGTLLNTVLTVVIGLAAWAIFAGFLHVKLMGVQPFG